MTKDAWPNVERWAAEGRWRKRPLHNNTITISPSLHLAGWLAGHLAGKNISGQDSLRLRWRASGRAKSWFCWSRDRLCISGVIFSGSQLFVSLLLKFSSFAFLVLKCRIKTFEQSELFINKTNQKQHVFLPLLLDLEGFKIEAPLPLFLLQ